MLVKKIHPKLLLARRTLESLSNVEVCRSVTDLQRLEAIQALVEHGNLQTFVPLLPACFNLNGYPFTLDDHFALEPVFKRSMPEVLTIKGARQFGKSTFQAARSLLVSLTMPYFSTLFVFPLFEQVNRFSTQYVGKFLEESPIKSAWMGPRSSNSVLTKAFSNFSKMTFSFAGLSAERIRSVSANSIIFDEAQNLDRRQMPVISEVMSHSLVYDRRTQRRVHAKFTVITGTPKTLDNFLEVKWAESSMAEWVIPCVCGKENYPARGMDLEKMIGPMYLESDKREIGEVRDNKRPGTICAKCGRSIDPRIGFWHHRHPDRIATKPGLHVPQCIIPVHYAQPKGWATLLGKQAGSGNYTTAKLYNEVHGESFDLGAKLLTETDLKAAAVLPWHNNPMSFADLARSIRSKYVCLFMGVDWGGGGESEVSFTTAAVLGMLPDGRIDIVYGRRLLLSHDNRGENEILLNIYDTFGCSYFCHDYNGAGALIEQYLVQSGLPINQVVPFVYYRSAAKDIVVFHQAAEEHHRSYYHLDKARALELVCEMIKLKQIRSFKYDHISEDERGLLIDFTSLAQAKIETARAGEVHTVQRVGSFPDDFAHSVTFAACGIWHANGIWPDLPMLAKLMITKEQEEALNPSSSPWDVQST